MERLQLGQPRNRGEGQEAARVEAAEGVRGGTRAGAGQQDQRAQGRHPHRGGGGPSPQGGEEGPQPHQHGDAQNRRSGEAHQPLPGGGTHPDEQGAR